jgi:nucleoside 2-deoxyribosyltransferase
MLATLGAQGVERQVALAGVQVDIVVDRSVEDGSTRRTIVECKAYDRPVGANEIRSLGAVLELLQERALAQSALIVSQAGFSNDAREVAQQLGIDLVRFADLEAEARAAESSGAYRHADRDARDEERVDTESRRAPTVFVVMPFAPEYEDLYILGIREVAEKLDLAVERADEIEHNSAIIAVVRKKISECDIVVAETTSRNANVYYELGFADGVGKEAVLLTRSGNDPPFDIRDRNHIMYASIVDLRIRLDRRLRETLERLRQGPGT